MTTPPVTGPSVYHDADAVRAAIERGEHRAVIGGLWEEMGRLQLDFLKGEGLEPRHRLVDIGCGSLRAGLPLAAYLDPGHYFGIDIRRELLDAGLREVGEAGLQDRLPPENLHATAAFDLSPFGVRFDYAIAQSVFTHIPLDELTACLSRIRPFFHPGGKVFVTVFERPPGLPSGPMDQKAGIVTFCDRDPFDVTAEALQAAIPEGWTGGPLRDWNHPRGQKMICITASA